MCKISVIVPIYKVERFLKKCLDSIVRQTYKDLEVLLIDDGSPDSCGNICDLYASSDNRIKVIHKKNQGIAEAYKDALKMVTGEWISFVDSDDWLEQNMYCTLMDHINTEKNIDIVIFNHYANIGSKERIIKDFEKEFVVSKPDAIYGLQCSVLCKKYAPVDCYNLQGTVWNKLYKKDLFLQFDINELLPAMNGGQDTIINILAFQYAKKVTYIDQCLYHFRINPNSDTQKFTVNEDERQELTFNTIIDLGKRFNLDRQYENAVNVATVRAIGQMGYRKYFNGKNELSFRERYKEARYIVNTPRYKAACAKVNLLYLDKRDRFLLTGHRLNVFHWLLITVARKIYQRVRYYCYERT